MKGYTFTSQALQQYHTYLLSEEKSSHTIEKYLRDVQAFLTFCQGNTIQKETVIAYKQHLLDKGYAARSINSMLSSLHSFFQFNGWSELTVKSLKVQQLVFCPEEKMLTLGEYRRLCDAAEKEQDSRLSLLLQTICATGIRVSELKYITLESVKKGEATVSLKGKIRRIFIVKKLQNKLLRYASEQKIGTGCLFITRGGKPLSRSNIWREMKKLCEKARVDPEKVYPHNLRHLFAREFFKSEKDIVKLADILGHSNINTTRIYTISSGKEHRKCMEKINLLL